MKPVELICKLVTNSSKANDVIYDPFGGSGTTMVACEQLSRRCRMMELHPPYCAVILERMAAMLDAQVDRKIVENQARKVARKLST